MQRLKELLSVFLPGLELKRWLIVVFLGLLQMAIGTALWLGGFFQRGRDTLPFRVVTLRFLPRFSRGLVFVATGGWMTYLGWQRLSRSLMRVMLPERSETTGLTQVLMERQRAERGRRVVVIGGDPGLTPIIKALRLLREDIRIDVILSPGERGKLAQQLRDTLGLSGPQIIYPTIDDAILYAELEDESLLEGTATINRFTGGTIKDLFLSRDIRRVKVWESESNGKGVAERLRDYMPGVAEPAIEAIQQAELIIFAPGRLYTQVLPNLTLPRLGQALQESEASKILVANLMTEPGKTAGWTVADHLETILRLSSVTFGYVIVHQGGLSDTMLSQYQNEGSEVVHLQPEEEGVSRLIFADTGEETTIVEGAVVIASDIVTEAPQVVTFQRGETTILREMPVVRHDPQKLSVIFQQLLADHEEQ